MKKKFRKLARSPRAFFRDMVAKRLRRSPRLAAELSSLERRVTLRPPLAGRFRYSVISAVYGVEKYLDDYFASLVHQTLDFEKHIELILVDDGSPDGSAEVIRKWRARYPENIRYVRKANGGQASARNVGIPLATGDWVTFIDPDDFVDIRYFEHVDSFLSRRDSGRVGLLCCRLLFYQEETKQFRDTHALRYRFRGGDRILGPDDEQALLQLSASTAFFDRRRLLENELRFDERIRPCFEDAHLVGRYLLAAQDIDVGISSRATYFYRKRSNASSTVDGSWKHPGRYGDVIEFGYVDLLARAARANGGRAPLWAQRMVLYEAMWHLRLLLDKPATADFLNDAQLARYKSLFREMFEPISVEAILPFELAGSWFFHKVGILGLFKGEEPPFQHVYLDGYDAQKKLLRARYFFHGQTPLEVFELDGVEVPVAFAKTRRRDFLGETFARERILWIPADDPAATLVARIGTAETKISLGGRTHPAGLPVSKAIARFAPKPPLSRTTPLRVRLDRALAGTPPFRARYVHAWLFMDRDTQADDNAEHLYRYVRANHPDVNAWFVLRESSSDWARLEREGFRLIPFGSRAHRAALLNADHLISSHADHYVLGFLEKKWYGDALRYRTTFLQHGVIKDDLSGWLNSKPIDLFVTASAAEAESIAGDDSPYNFSWKEVVLSGLPRHDALLAGSSAPDNLVIVMPTWRQSLVGRTTGRSSTRDVNPDFYRSEYARSWRSFLHSPRLRELAMSHGYRIVFFPHANVQPYIDWFDAPPHVEVMRHHGGGSIQELFRRAAIMVTDYSSVAFEMAYLRKPTLYYQFDHDTVFRGGHTYRPGYYDYERDGFGPVARHESELLSELDALLARGGAPTPEHLERMERTFAFRDGACCRRVYQAIVDLGRPVVPSPHAESHPIDAARHARREQPDSLEA